MYKLCPFCKEQIEKSEAKCPFCKRTLIERVEGLQSVHPKKTDQNLFIKKINSFKTKIEQKLKKNIHILKHFKLPRFPINIKNSIIASVILFVITNGLFGGNRNTNNTSSQLPIQNENKISYHSLPNGTVIHSLIADSNALGQLKIKNGTDYDAIVKLVDKQINSSVFTVYLKAKSEYTIGHIKDGIYDLKFNTGNDWNEQDSKFLVGSSYSKFRDNFVYATTETEEYDAIHTRYATFEVTLNPVVGGQAKTDDISEAEFSKL